MDNYITIDGEEYDMYFILGVTEDDSMDHINKVFRSKAKLLHPDKLSSDDKRDKSKVLLRSKQFKILVECYNSVKNIKTSFVNKNAEREDIETFNNTNLETKGFENTSELNSFNQEFEKLRVRNPNDFGYKTSDRMRDLDEYKKFEPNTYKLFENKKFDPNDFNKVFEYQQLIFNQQEPSKDLTIHKTSDGFSGYNTANLGNCASVNSFNGVLLVGDNFGETGVGYYGEDYSDYRQSFGYARNPETKINVPTGFKTQSEKQTKMSPEEIERQMNIQKNHKIQRSGTGNKSEFYQQQTALLKKQNADMKKKATDDKDFILKYRNMFPQQTIDDALNDRLLASKDYTKFL